jgi:APA family basic amino acid/polyamine antiporter
VTENQPRTGALLRVLGVGFGIAVLVGNTIGSGILRVPGEIAGHLPSTVFFLGVWIAGGIYALLGSNALAEVASMVRESGGYTVFVRRGLGPYLGFVAGWSDWLSSCTSATAAAVVVGESARALGNFSPATIAPIACLVLFVFALIQWRGVRAASGTQGLTSAAKALVFLLFVIICFTSARFNEAAPPIALPRGVSLLAALVLAMQAVIFTFDGWIGPAYFAGELRDPGRELPRSIFGGVLAVIAIYLLVNFALLHVIPIARLAHDPFAVGTAMAEIFGPRGDSLVRVLVILVVISLINAVLMQTSRIFYALSCANHFSLGTIVNRGGTPTVALLVSTVAAAFFLVGGTYNRIIAITAFLFVANYTFTFLSLFALRVREPNTPRPYRAWGHPWTTGFVLLVSLGLLAGALAADTRNSLISIALLLISYPIFLVIKRRANA